MTLVSSLNRLALMLVAPLALHAQVLRAQSLAPSHARPREARPGTTVNAVAIGAPAPPVLDGKDDDPIWRTAPEITAFQQFSPRAAAHLPFARR